MFHNIKNAIEPVKNMPQLSITPVSVPCQAAFTIIMSLHVAKDEPNVAWFEFKLAKVTDFMTIYRISVGKDYTYVFVLFQLYQ